MVFDPPDALRGSFSLAARVAVVDKAPFENGVDVVEQQVVHDPVTELRSEDLTFDRPLDDEAVRRAGLVAPCRQFFVQAHQVRFEVHLEFQLAGRVPLVPSRLEVSRENVFQQLAGICTLFCLCHRLCHKKNQTVS